MAVHIAKLSKKEINVKDNAKEMFAMEEKEKSKTTKR
jgi:hypothetical protein